MEVEVPAGSEEGESLILIIVWFSGKYKTYIFKLSFPEHEIKTEPTDLVEQADDITINLTTLGTNIQIKQEVQDRSTSSI